MSRREFLKWGGAAAFGAIVGLPAGARLYSFIKERLEEPEESEERNDEVDLKNLEVISYESGEPINLAHIEKLKEKWKLAYSEGDHRGVLASADKKIQPIDAQLHRAFQGEGVPGFLRYLAIPESEGNPNARSPVGARGMFQLMPETARKYELRVNSRHDDRLDPVKSGHAAAQILKDISQVADGDWRIALAGYNGGYIWKYLNESAEKKESPTYENFLEFMNEKIQRVRSDVKHGQIIHKVKKKESVSAIARRYGISNHEIMKANRLSSDKIHPGQKLSIPLADPVSKKRAFRVLTRGFRENIEYVPKVYAVAELLDDRAYFNK